MGKQIPNKLESFLLAQNEKWIGLLSIVSGVSFLSWIILIYLKMDLVREFMMWLTILLVLCEITCTFWVANEIRKGRRPALSETQIYRHRIIGAWLGVAWFFIIGVLCLAILWGAPVGVIWLPWLIVAVSAIAGLLLLWRRQRTA